MGCGTSRDSSNYHGVAARFGAVVLNTSTTSNMLSAATSETSSEASNDSGFEDELQPAPIKRGKRKNKTREKKKRKRKQDQMLNFGDFRVKMVDELGKEDMKYQRTSAVERTEGPCVIKQYHLTTCGGHASRVKMTLVAGTERLILSCSNEDATVSLWDAQGQEVGRLVGHDDAVIGGCVNADSRMIATTSRDGTLIVWDLSTQKIMMSLNHPKVVVCCCFSPDSLHVVSGCQDQVCRVWDLRTNKEIMNFNDHRGIVMAIAFAPNGNFIASGGSDKKVCLWTLQSPRAKLTFVGHTGAVLSLDINLSSTQVVSTDEKLVLIWKSDDGTRLQQFDSAAIAASGLHRRSFWNCVSFGPGTFNDLIVIGCTNRTLYFYHVEGREELSVYLRASVCSLARGNEHLVVAGDTFGNNYIVTLQ